MARLTERAFENAVVRLRDGQGALGQSALDVLHNQREELANQMLARLAGSDEFAAMLERNFAPYRRLMTYYECAMMEVETKFRVLDAEFGLQHDRNPIESIKSRLKSTDSLAKKLARKGFPMSVDSIEQNIYDVAGVQDPDIRPKATEEIGTMIALIERLIERGHAYVSEGDVYFDVRSYPGYGQLSGRDVDEAESGHRELRADGQGLEERKRDELDFALWKAAKPGEPAWESPWGEGRPGWHIECSAMSEKYLGLPFDIHGGGADLVFPHHENERAQSECACDSTFANYWMHSGMLQIANAETGETEKMSKSLNNFLLLHEVLEQVRPAALRMLMLQSHYRSPLVFGEQRVAEADAALTRIENAVKALEWLLETGTRRGEAALEPETPAAALAATLDAAALTDRVAVLRAGFTEAMDDDFNAPAALGEVFSFVSDANALVVDAKTLAAEEAAAVREARDAIVELMDVLGIDVTAAEVGEAYPVEVVALAADLAGYDGDDPEIAVARLLEARATARKEKNWAVADGVRNGLADLGFVIEDTPQGARVTFEG